MKNTIGFILALLFATFTYGQPFEGEITYKNSYTSKMPNVKSEQFAAMMGSVQEYYIKNGNYKSITNGSLVQWQLYVNKDNKLYNKMGNTETLLWNDGSVNQDEVLKAEVNKGTTEILGYKCDELSLTCKSGTQKYYFSTELSVEPTLFINHKFGNWYDYVLRSKALPLKSIVENAQFILVSEATAVKAMKLEDVFFRLPPDSKTMKSPY